MEYKEFFKFTKTKLLIGILIILLFPIIHDTCSMWPCSGYELDIPIIPIVGVLSYSITSSIDFGFSLIEIFIFELLFTSSFLLNIIIAYPLACYLIKIYEKKEILKVLKNIGIITFLIGIIYLVSIGISYKSEMNAREIYLERIVEIDLDLNSFFDNNETHHLVIPDRIAKIGGEWIFTQNFNSRPFRFSLDKNGYVTISYPEYKSVTLEGPIKFENNCKYIKCVESKPINSEW